jgi:hypothetical protein
MCIIFLLSEEENFFEISYKNISLKQRIKNGYQSLGRMHRGPYIFIGLQQDRRNNF